VRRRYQVRVDGKQKSSSCEGDSGSEDETRAGTIEEIPNSRVREGEGETELEGWLPGKTTLQELLATEQPKEGKQKLTIANTMPTAAPMNLTTSFHPGVQDW
jgi:hypothetical protein